MSTPTPPTSPATPQFTLIELCRSCAVHTDYIAELVQEGLISPATGSSPETWRFTSVHVRTTQVAWRLQRDLGVNLPGAALALQLMQELDTLRAQLAHSNPATVIDVL
jgi:chaperone modulatory protein CbpM